LRSSIPWDSAVPGAAAKPLRVAVVSKSDGGDGGASRVAEQCVTWLREAGVQATQFVGFSSGGANEPHEIYWPSTRAGRRFYRLQKLLGFPDLIPIELPKLWSAVVGHYDVVHFHQLSSTISPLTLRALAPRIPVVWTFHECSPFTGGCLYPMGCTKFETTCSACPSDSWPLDTPVKFTALLQQIRAYPHAHPNVTCTVPTQWLADMALKSRVVKKMPLVVSNRIDLAQFRPTEKLRARRLLGLACGADTPLLLLSATSVGDPRKGAREGIAALRAMTGAKPGILLMGKPDASVEAQLAPYRVHSFGYVRDADQQALIYSAANAFIFPTLAEVQGLAVIESLACGTPVLGFASGGVPSMIDQGRTGILVPTGDVAALSEALDKFLADHRTPWAENCIAAARVYDKSVFVREHIALYETAIARFLPG
jgi:glycosyltransferase involved in cell wall biosynthesis